MPPAFRPLMGVAVCTVTAAVVAVILGEYEFKGVTPWLAGVVVGFLMGELMLAVAHRRLLVLAAATAALAAGSLLWAGWIDSGEGVRPYPSMAWVAAGLAAAVAGWRTRPTSPPAGGSK